MRCWPCAFYFVSNHHGRNNSTLESGEYRLSHKNNRHVRFPTVTQEYWLSTQWFDHLALGSYRRAKTNISMEFNDTRPLTLRNSGALPDELLVASARRYRTVAYIISFISKYAEVDGTTGPLLYEKTRAHLEHNKLFSST